MKELQSLDDIFNKKLFRIPDYQRGYAWGEKQLVDFWEDLLSLSNGRSHYTGVISIKAVPKEIYSNWNDEKWVIEKKKHSPFFVVDGQQRLTTVSIFLQCLVEIIESLPENKGLTSEDMIVGAYSLKEIRENFVMTSMPPHHIIKTYKFGYETDNPSFEFLRHKIFNEEHAGNIEETFYTLNLENAKTFFSENIQILVDKNGSGILEELYDKVTQRLMFNLYEIDDNFDVFVAFETMNNRGKRLSDLELLKNRLIYLTTLYDESEVSDEDKNATRDAINDAWRTVYYQLGRNKKHPLNDDEFLRAHWIMYFKYSRKKGNDYIHYLLDEQFNPKNVLKKVPVELSKLEEVSETIDEQDFDDDDAMVIDEISTVLKASLPITEIHEYVNSLKVAAVHWYNTFFPEKNVDLSDEEQVVMDQINRLGISYFRPLIMTAFLKTNKEATERLQLMKAIERFIFIGFRVSRAASNYKSSLFYNSTRDLYIYNGKCDDNKTGTSPQEIVSLIEGTLAWIYNEDNSFKSSYFKDFITKKFKSGGDGFYGWNGLRYLLYEYEENLKKTRNQPKISWKNFVRNEREEISVEHIFPQTASDTYWLDKFSQFSDEEKKLLNGSLGNLLPLSSSINSSLQNDSFPDKKTLKCDDNGEVIRNGYDNGSYSELEVAKIDDWTATEIKERGFKLLSFMEQRWNINFGSTEEKLDLLHLSFLSENKELD